MASKTKSISSSKVTVVREKQLYKSGWRNAYVVKTGENMNSPKEKSNSKVFKFKPKKAGSAKNALTKARAFYKKIDIKKPVSGRK